MLQFLPHQNGLTLIMLSFFCMVIKKIVALTNLSQQNTLFTHTHKICPPFATDNLYKMSGSSFPAWSPVWSPFPWLTCPLVRLSQLPGPWGSSECKSSMRSRSGGSSRHAPMDKVEDTAWTRKENDGWERHPTKIHSNTTHFFYQLLTLFCTLPLLVLLDACMSNLFHKLNKISWFCLHAYYCSRYSKNCWTCERWKSWSVLYSPVPCSPEIRLIIIIQIIKLTCWMQSGMEVSTRRNSRFLSGCVCLPSTSLPRPQAKVKAKCDERRRRQSITKWWCCLNTQKHSK